jgi:phosphoribosylformylglycinamidine synthase subunit PurQ / glutaminase
MKFAIVVFPGSNCDHDAHHAAKHVLGQDAEFVWHKDTSLGGADVVILPGGFAHGDYLRTGAIARFSPVMKAVQAFADAGGPVLGVCNGFQILTESGLLPGALTRNVNMRFECRDILVKVTAEGPFTPQVGKILRLPIAHGEGRYQASPEVLAKLDGEGRIALVYEGEDPNGSVRHIAGIYGGPNKNVLGLMPHPERMSEDCLGGTDGLELFNAVVSRRRAA